MNTSTMVQRALETATVRTFRVPGVGHVRVEIGDELAHQARMGRPHAYPAYRVALDGEPIAAGVDWGVPHHRCTDDVNAMLELLATVAWETGNDALERWVGDRRDLRNALTDPWFGGWREAVAAHREEHAA